MQITLDLPEQFSLEASPKEWGQRLKLYAAITMYQSGKLSAVAACELANVDRFTFINECAKLNISMIDYEEGELSGEIRNISESHVAKEKPAAGHSFGAVKVTKRGTLEQMDEAIRQRGGTL